MKKILGIVLLLGLVAFSTEKVYIFRFTEPQINFHWQNLEAIKQIMDQSALPHNQVKQAVNAIDSLQKDMRMVLAIDKIRMKVDEK
jgi:predicted DNA-binding ArsR family transcriptional regulator